MLKRICAFCLILVLTASLITALPVSAASDSEIQLVGDLGIIDISDNTGLIPKGFSRSDFARSLCLMEKNDTPPFVSAEAAAAYASDIAGNANCNFIVAAITAGYMETDSDGKFNPGKSVSLKDAVVALVKMLGYEPMAEANGGTYDDYYAIALKTKLLNGVSVENSEELTAVETAEILANTMNARLFVPHNVDYGEDCLWDRWNISVNTGKILANSNMGLLVERTDCNHINIDGKIYYTKLLIENELVGSNVTYYVGYGDMGDEVVSIYVRDYGDTVTLKSNEIEAISDNGSILTVKTDDKKSLKLDKKGFLIVNGKTMSPSMSLFNAFESGTATFVDSDNNGIYDVVNMTLLFQTVISGVNPESETLATRYDNQIINLEKVDNYEVYLGKKAATLSDLTAGMTVGIACDSFIISNGKLVLNFTDAEYIRLYASNRQSTGYITAMIDEDRFEIEEITKYFGSGYKHFVKEKHIPELKVGDYIVAYYDNLGQLTYFEISSEKGLRYGYVVAAGRRGNSLNKTTEVKILDTDGKFNIYTTGKKFILDGARVDGGETIYTVNEVNDVDLTKRQLVRFRAEEGILKEIDTKVVRTSSESKQTSLDEALPFDVNTVGNAKYKIRSGAVDRKFAFTAGCVAFVDEAPIADTNPSENLFSVTTIGTSDAEYSMAGYDANDNNELSCVVRYDSYGMTGTEAKGSMGYYGYNGYVVEKVLCSIDSDGNTGWTITVAGDDAITKYFVPEETLRLYESTSAADWSKEYIDVYPRAASTLMSVVKPGDVIRFRTNNAGNINYIEKLFDFNSHKDSIATVPDASGQIYGFVKIEKISGQYFIYSYDDPLDTTKYISRKRQIYSKVPLYHVSTGEIEMLDISQIPSMATGNQVKAFLRYYGYGSVYDQIFYIYD